jgi:hypothetical protein
MSSRKIVDSPEYRASTLSISARWLTDLSEKLACKLASLKERIELPSFRQGSAYTASSSPSAQLF